VINSKIGPICHHFRDTFIYRLKLSIEDIRDMVTIDSL